MTEQFPPIPEPLLKELNRRFPDRCPRVSQSNRDIWMAVGARKVVEFLTEEFKRQNPLTDSPSGTKT